MTTTMNTVNQIFDWSRFTATLRKEFVENKRGILFTAICIYGLLTLIMILGNLIAAHNHVTMQEMFAAKAPQIVVAMILTLVVCVSASMAFIGLKTKTSRASYLTSPSSTFEKFLVNILIYVVGIFIAYFACAQLADLTRIAVLWFFKSENFLVHGPINFLTCLSDMASIYDEPELGLKGFDTMITVGLIANAGLYLLGSIIWPRLSLLKTFAAVYAIEFALFLIALPFFVLIDDTAAFAQWFYNYMTGGYFTTSTIIFVIIQIVLYFGLAWYLFKRKDVISLKWWK